MVSLPLKVLYGNIIIIIPVLVSYYLSLSSTTSTNTSNDFQIVKILISDILAQNLLIANTTRERGVLTHALLELQNPELTVFAGAGYGVHLRHPNPGATIEPFPNGRLPQAGGSRYDPWTMVKGLRYAAGIIVTDGSVGPAIEDDEFVDGSVQSRIRRKSAGIGGESRKLRKGGWLLYQDGDRSAVDAAGLGWATLLLERAGAVDVQNPVGQGRNAYGEAADGMLDWLYDETKNVRLVIEDRDSAVIVGHSQSWEADQAQTRQVEQDRWAISYMCDSPQLNPETIFLVPPFLAAYAIARQDNYWLLEAIEQIRMHEKVLAKGKGLWRLLAVDPNLFDHRLLDEPNCFTGSTWALTGIVRVLVVLERWQHQSSAEMWAKLSEGRKELLKFAGDILHQLQSFAKDNSTGLLRGQLEDRKGVLKGQLDNHKEYSSGYGVYVPSGNALATAAVVSSVYRLAQVGLLENLGALIWADELYNALADWIDVSVVSRSVPEPAEGILDPNRAERSELHSMILMMYAARRDCAELRICRPPQPERWNIWPLSIFT